MGVLIYWSWLSHAWLTEMQHLILFRGNRGVTEVHRKTVTHLTVIAENQPVCFLKLESQEERIHHRAWPNKQDFSSFVV